MWKKQITVAALVLGASGTASAYDIGKLTCQNVGQLAAQMLLAKQSGVPPEAYLSALNEKLPADASVERQLAVRIAQVVYGNDQVSEMKPEEVYVAFAQNCMSGQEEDRMSGQQDDDMNSDDDSTGAQEDDSTTGQQDSPLGEGQQ